MTNMNFTHMSAWHGGRNNSIFHVYLRLQWDRSPCAPLGSRRSEKSGERNFSSKVLLMEERHQNCLLVSLGYFSIYPS